MKPRKELLSWLNPELDAETAERAGELLDAVAIYLRDVGPSTLFDEPPAITFDPIASSSFRPEPQELPGRTDRAVGISAGISDELPWLPPQEIAELIRSGAVSRGQVIEAFAGRIRDWEPILNSFIRVTLDSAGEVAGSREIAGASAGRLAGVPIGVQDMIFTAGLPTTAGSSILSEFVPEFDAESWRRLAADGAVLAGKLNTQEFAAGTTGENPHFGDVRNPWDPSRTAGGAAGGAGAAIAAGLIPAAIATDPGGSIRVPAALCGVVGLKPTFASMDRAGTIPLTWTTETLGVLAQTVGGAAFVADRLLDDRARSWFGLSCEDAALRGSQRTRLDLRVGIPTNWLEMGLEADVERAYREAAAQLTAMGATVREVELPDAGAIAPAHRAIAFSEASSIHEQILQDQADRYGDNVRDRQEAGRGVMASEYLKAFRLRGRFARQFSEVWRDVDIVITPTSPVQAARLGTPTITTGSRGEEPAHTIYTRYSAPLSTLGLPSLSVPCGFTEDGMPVGLQLVGPPHSEPLLFYIAAAYEAATPWHLRHPQLSAARDTMEASEVSHG